VHLTKNICLTIFDALAMASMGKEEELHELEMDVVEHVPEL